MKNVIVIPNPHKDEDFVVTNKVIDKLVELELLVYVDETCGILSRDGVITYAEPPKNADLIVVIGGDGSVIDASRYAVMLDIPLLGVNLGKIGYLSEVEPDNLSLLDELSKGNYEVESKMLLAAEYISAKGKTVVSERYAVNDVVISQDGYFGIADFSVENSRHERVNYRGNGIVVATPVGSTAYSLSAGGPIIAHNLDSITVTPVCSHSFFNRSIVYEPDEVISIVNKGKLSLNISIDGRNFEALSEGDVCRIYSCEHRFKMITFSESNMFSTLFTKIRVFEDKV